MLKSKLIIIGLLCLIFNQAFTQSNLTLYECGLLDSVFTNNASYSTICTSKYPYISSINPQEEELKYFPDPNLPNNNYIDIKTINLRVVLFHENTMTRNFRANDPGYQTFMQNVINNLNLRMQNMEDIIDPGQINICFTDQEFLLVTY